MKLTNKDPKQWSATLAEIGSAQLSVAVTEGRLDIVMTSDIGRKSIGLTLMGEDRARFKSAIHDVLRTLKRAPR